MVRLEGGIPAILAGLKLHGHSSEYHKQAFKFLIKLSQNGKNFQFKNWIFLEFSLVNNVGAIIRANGVNDIMRIILSADDEILKFALQVLINLTKSGKKIRKIQRNFLI